MKNVKCPYCGSEDVFEIDVINYDANTEGGFVHSLYGCNSCKEDFYVIMGLEVCRIQTSKEKWKNYNIVYSKNK